MLVFLLAVGGQRRWAPWLLRECPHSKLPPKNKDPSTGNKISIRHVEERPTKYCIDIFWHIQTMEVYQIMSEYVAGNSGLSSLLRLLAEI